MLISSSLNTGSKPTLLPEALSRPMVTTFSHSGQWEETPKWPRLWPILNNTAPSSTAQHSHSHMAESYAQAHGSSHTAGWTQIQEWYLTLLKLPFPKRKVKPVSHDHMWHGKQNTEPAKGNTQETSWNKGRLGRRQSHDGLCRKPSNSGWHRRSRCTRPNAVLFVPRQGCHLCMWASEYLLLSEWGFFTSQVPLINPKYMDSLFTYTLSTLRGICLQDIKGKLNVLVACIGQLRIHYQWKPTLNY